MSCPTCDIAKERLGPAGWRVLEERERLKKALEICRAALRVQAKHNGYCDGPLGCGCSALKAQEALAQVDKILGESK